MKCAPDLAVARFECWRVCTCVCLCQEQQQTTTTSSSSSSAYACPVGLLAAVRSWGLHIMGRGGVDRCMSSWDAAAELSCTRQVCWLLKSSRGVVSLCHCFVSLFLTQLGHALCLCPDVQQRVSGWAARAQPFCTGVLWCLCGVYHVPCTIRYASCHARARLCVCAPCLTQFAWLNKACERGWGSPSGRGAVPSLQSVCIAVWGGVDPSLVVVGT
jgi:hypothetical protein